MPFARPAGSGDGKDEFDAGQINLLMPGNADRPGKAARAQSLAKRRTHAIARVGEDRPETNAGPISRSSSASAISGLARAA